MWISLGLNIIGNNDDDISTRPDKIYNKDLVVFRHFIEKMLLIIYSTVI